MKMTITITKRITITKEGMVTMIITTTSIMFLPPILQTTNDLG